MDTAEINAAVERFHAGEWSDALLELRRAETLAGEAAAARALCEGMVALPLEPVACDPAIIAAVESALDEVEAEQVSWPDVTTARVWAAMLRQYHEQPSQTPDALVQLAEYGQTCLWFPGWVLAPRALAYFDRRSLLRRWCTETGAFAAGAPVEHRLAWIEAGLECGLLDAATLLQHIEFDQCPPPMLPVVRLWTAWLQAEYSGWITGTAELAFKKVDVLLSELSAPDDLFLGREWDRITQRIGVLGARLTCRHKEQADHWLATLPPSWDTHYAHGLTAWAAGDYALAGDYFAASQQANPFQSRVAFEAAMLTDYPVAALPAVPDMRAMAALLHFRAGNPSDAEAILDTFEEAVEPFSLRLISPAGYQQRIQRGQELSAHLAETRKDWRSALARWDTARQKRPRDLMYRAHRLYLMRQLLHEQAAMPVEAPDPRNLWDNFQRELGLLSVRELSPDAQFYRALAAAQEMPQLAAKDWIALSENDKWRAKASREYILALADGLCKAGLWDQAYRIYAAAPANLLPSALGRILVAEDLDAGEMLSALENVENNAGGTHLLAFAHTLLLSMQDGTTSAEAAVGLQDELVTLLQCLVTGVVDKPLHTALQRASPLLTPLLRITLSLFAGDLNAILLRDFQAGYSRNFAISPIDGGWVVGQQIRRLSLQGDFESALSWVDMGRQLNLPSMDDWLAYIKLARSLALARAGRFDDAQKEI